LAPALALAAAPPPPSAPALASTPSTSLQLERFTPSIQHSPAAASGTIGGSFEAMAAFLDQRQDKAESKVVALLTAQHEHVQKQHEQVQKLEARVVELTPKELISVSQIEALEARLEACHSSKLISDDELYSLEDTVADYLEAKAAFDVVTTHVASANHAVAKLHKLIVLSEGLSKDETFARQVRRKFV
jgi:hypothetical protein